MNKHSIMNFQSRNTSVALRVYCDIINNSDADVFVVMARKAVCLVKYLFAKGQIKESKYEKFVSSNALLYDISSFTEKKVAIVDDIIISGSALATTANQLISAGVKEEDLEIIALVRDSEYQTMHFTRTSDGKSLLKCAMDAKDAECIEISYDISHIITHSGMQYDADYPAFDPVLVTKEDISRLTNSIDWHLYEVTNEVQRKGNISAFSLFPKKSTLTRFWNAIGLDLEEIVHIKVRLYFRDYASGKCKVNIVPMAFFNEISEEMLNTLFAMLPEKDMLYKCEGWSLKAKMHFLQYYIAFMLQRHLVQCSISQELKRSSADLHFNFGPTTSACISSYLDNQNTFVNTDDTFAEENVEPCLLGYEKSAVYALLHGNDTPLDANTNTILIDPIKWWYISKELSARRQLCEMAPHFLHDRKVIEECLQRLKYGFSLRALMKLADDKDCEIPKRHKVSLFLDRAIDEGFIVPVDFYNENTGYYCRAYRHGEDLPFSEADKFRLLFFLQKLDKCFRSDNGDKTEYIAETTFEKMIVLFYQIGLKKGRMFNRFLGFGKDPILQQRFNVHGIVAAINEALAASINHHVYLSSEPDNDGKSTTMITGQFSDYPYEYICKNNHFFHIRPEKVKEYLDASSFNNMSEEIKDDISLIANMIEKWYCLQCKDGSGKGEFKDDISALTSCSDTFTFASSIATEVHYFKRYWEEEARKLLLDLRQGNEVASFSSNRFSQALPSGRDKHEWFDDGRAHYVMKYVPEIFASAGLYNEERFWKTLWRDELTTKIPGSNKLSEYTNKSLQFLYFYSDLYEWLCNDVIRHVSTPGTTRTYYDKYERLQEKSDTDYYYIFDFAEKKKSLAARIDYLIQSIDGVIEESENVVRQIEICLNEKVGTYSVEYFSGFIVEFDTSPNEDTDQIWREFWKKLPETGEKTHINIVDLGTSIGQKGLYGVFHTEAGWLATETLLNLYESFHILSCQKAWKSRTVFISDFPPTMSFLHNLRSNINRNAEAFMKEYKQATADLVHNMHTHELAVLIHDDVEPDILEHIDQFISKLGYADLRTSSTVYRGMDIYYRQYGCGNIDSEDKLINSSVQIKVNGKHAGTGFLFSHHGNLLCVSSQHLLDKSEPIQSIHALSAANGFEFELHLKNRKEHKQLDKRVAKEDVLVCSVDLSNCADFDSRYIFSKDDCLTDTKYEHHEAKYTFFGYGEGSDNHGKRNPQLKTMGPVARGFVEMQCCEGKVEPGDSGAAVVSKQGNTLYGIHAQSTAAGKDENQRLLICPIKILLEELRNL